MARIRGLGVALAALGLGLAAGCGGPGKDAPRFWYDEASRQRLPEDYRLPDHPADPDNVDEYVGQNARSRRPAPRYDDGYDAYGYTDDAYYGTTDQREEQAYRQEHPGRLGDDYQGREYGSDPAYRDERMYQAERYGYDTQHDPLGMDRPRMKPAR